MNDLAIRLWALLGARLDEERMVRLLDALDVHWRPMPTKVRSHDWISIGNAELGFELAESFTGKASAAEAQAPVLQQVSLFAPRPGHSGPVFAPPFGLSFSSSALEVRNRLQAFATSCRFDLRDTFDIDGRVAVAQAHPETALLDCLLLLIPRPPRPSKAIPAVGFEELKAWLGRPWHDEELRQRLYSLAESDRAVSQIKRHGSCDLVKEAGVRLLYERAGETWLLAGAEFFRARVQDAASVRDLPFGLAFEDMLVDVNRKLGGAPGWRADADLETRAWWPHGACRVSLVFDRVVNLVSSVTVAQSGYWSTS